MIKIMAKCWETGKDALKLAIIDRIAELRSCNYIDLVKFTFETIFNKNSCVDDDFTLNLDRITGIDDGNYQGTLLYMIPFDKYQPSAHEYFLTNIYYGSCSGCDALQHAQSLHYYDDSLPATKDEIVAFLNICECLVVNTIVPYNDGWCHRGEFEPIRIDKMED